ncbi:MAG TPA: hypothetical protein VI864_02665 [Candidatus Bathyarchaeia archaeon]|nr:hypothetical protein [Candidatus Bathyarchaeia archaeon]
MDKAVDRVNWKAKWRIDKFKDPTDEIAKMLRLGASMMEVMRQFPEAFIAAEEFESNIALNEGLQALIGLACAIGSETAWSNAAAYLGVGDSNAAENATHTGLQAATNKLWKAMDATYPQRTNQTVDWRATFDSAEANYAWEEYTVVNASSDTGKNLNRKIASKGTKSSGETWTLSLQITFS